MIIFTFLIKLSAEMVTLELLEPLHQELVVLMFVWMRHGEQFVLIPGIMLMPVFYASNWDFLRMVSLDSEHFSELLFQNYNK